MILLKRISYLLTYLNMRAISEEPFLSGGHSFVLYSSTQHEQDEKDKNIFSLNILFKVHWPHSSCEEGHTASSALALSSLLLSRVDVCY